MLADEVRLGNVGELVELILDLELPAVGLAADPDIGGHAGQSDPEPGRRSGAAQHRGRGADPPFDPPVAPLLAQRLDTRVADVAFELQFEPPAGVHLEVDRLGIGPRERSVGIGHVVLQVAAGLWTIAMPPLVRGTISPVLVSITYASSTMAARTRLSRSASAWARDSISSDWIRCPL